MDTTAFPLPPSQSHLFQEWVSELQIGARIKRSRLGLQSLCKITAEEWDSLTTSISQSKTLQNAEVCLRDFLSRLGLNSDIQGTAKLLAEDLRRRVLDYRSSESIENYPQYMYEIPKIRL